MVKEYDGVSLIGKVALQVIEEAVEKTRHLPYDMAEFGVFQGGSAKIISQAAPEKTLHLFDTFTQQPFDDVVVPGFKAGNFQVSLSDVLEYLKDLKVEYHVGVFQEISLPEIQYSFVHIDSDLYQNISAGIDYFYPRLVQGGIIVFDDFDNENCGGVRLALTERDLIDLVVPTPNYTQCLLVKP